MYPDADKLGEGRFLRLPNFLCGGGGEGTPSVTLNELKSTGVLQFAVLQRGFVQDDKVGGALLVSLKVSERACDEPLCAGGCEGIPSVTLGELKSTGVPSTRSGQALHFAARFRAASFRMTKLVVALLVSLKVVSALATNHFCAGGCEETPSVTLVS